MSSVIALCVTRPWPVEQRGRCALVFEPCSWWVRRTSDGSSLLPIIRFGWILRRRALPAWKASPLRPFPVHASIHNVGQPCSRESLSFVLLGFVSTSHLFSQQRMAVLQVLLQLVQGDPSSRRESREERRHADAHQSHRRAALCPSHTTTVCAPCHEPPWTVKRPNGQAVLAIVWASFLSGTLSIRTFPFKGFLSIGGREGFEPKGTRGENEEENERRTHAPTQAAMKLVKCVANDGSNPRERMERTDRSAGHGSDEREVATQRKD